mmetsp:Transcript_7661/g.24110  ORF Transcript_7661/g.24110 Transcript_7661/m.24110 type:complete len:526 (-) Transcript_7661:81-1658(-)
MGDRHAGLFFGIIATASALYAPPPRCARAPSVRAAGDWAEAKAASALDASKRVVMKFGGSSLRDAERIANVAELVAKHVREGYTPAVVVSAMGKTTNGLEKAGALALVDGRVRVDEIRQLHLETLDALALPAKTGYAVRQLLRELESLLDGVSMVRELTPRTKDLLVSFGERLSCRILAAQLDQAHGIKAVPVDSWSLGVRTTGGFGESVVDDSCYPEVARNLRSFVEDRDEVPVVTGYIGHDGDGRVTTLGRGGSDLTATVLGAAAPEGMAPFFAEVQVWKDVDGLMSADPRLVPRAAPVPFVTFEEAAELAYFGASVLHPISMLPAMKADVPVRVKNSYNADHPGTLIASPGRVEAARLVAGIKEPPPLTAITTKRGVTLVDIASNRMQGQAGFLARMFDVFERDGVSVDVVATSEVSVSLTLDRKAQLSENAVDELSEIASVDVRADRAIVSFIADVSRSTELIARVFTALAEHGISVEMLSQGASKVNISLVVCDSDAEKALELIHGLFFGAEAREEVVSR